MLATSQAFQVKSDGNPVKLKGQMLPLPRITVRVVDGKGKGIPGAQVELTGPNAELISHTNAEGNVYRPGFLFPGSYTLSAAPPSSLKPPDQAPDSDRVLNWTRTWYSGVPRPELASKIVLRLAARV